MRFTSRDHEGELYVNNVLGHQGVGRGYRPPRIITFGNLGAKTNAVVTPLRKAASYEPRISILGIWGDTWLTRGKYGIYVAVCGSYGVLAGST